MPAASAAAIEAAAFEWNAAKPEKRSEFEPAPAGSRGDAAEHVVAAEQVSDAVLADQPGRRLGIELGEADDMRAAGERSHRRGIPEGAAQRHRGEQRRVGRIEAHAAGDVGGVPGDGLLIVQDELRPAGRAGGGEGEAGRFARGLVRAGIGGCIAVKRQHRQAGDLGDAGRRLKPDHAAQRGAILRGQGGEDRGKIDRRESPFGYQRDRPRAAQKVADFRGAETGVEVDRERAEPGTGKDRCEVSGAVRQPQRHAHAGADAGRTEPRGGAQHALVEGVPAQRARGVGHRCGRRITPGPGQQRAQRARISRSIGLAHQEAPSTLVNGPKASGRSLRSRN